MNGGLIRTEHRLSEVVAQRDPVRAERTLHEVRRSILRKLTRQMNEIRKPRMKFGYTYIERGPSGGVMNVAFNPFSSIEECCIAAEEAVNSQSARVLQSTQVVYCRYDSEQCIPEMQPILKRYERSQVLG